MNRFKKSLMKLFLPMLVVGFMQLIEDEFNEIKSDEKKAKIIEGVKLFLLANGLEEYLDILKLEGLIEEKFLELINKK